MQISPSRLLILAAVIVWALVAAGAQIFGMTAVEEASLGLALYGAAALV